MKIVLDIDKLLHEGRITIEECARLKELAGQESRSLAFNILIAFGGGASAGVSLRISAGRG